MSKISSFGHAMAESCQRQSRNGFTQGWGWTVEHHLSPITQEATHFNVPPEVFTYVPLAPFRFPTWHNSRTKLGTKSWQVAKEAPAAVPILSVFGDLVVPVVPVVPVDGTVGWKGWTLAVWKKHLQLRCRLHQMAFIYSIIEWVYLLQDIARISVWSMGQWVNGGWTLKSF